MSIGRTDLLNVSHGSPLSDCTGLGGARFPVDGGHSASSLDVDSLGTADVGVAIPGVVGTGAGGPALVVNLRAGCVAGDWAGLGGVMASADGGVATSSLSRCLDVGTVGVGVVISTWGLADAGFADVGNLSAGVMIGDPMGVLAVVSVNGYHAAGICVRDGSLDPCGVAIRGDGI